MRWLGVLVLVVASCAQDGGVIIEVTPSDPSVDQIRLYIGTGDLTKDVTLEIPVSSSTTTNAVERATYWSRDDRNELDTRQIASGETARFVLVRSDTNYIGALIAVGYSQGKVVEVATKFGLDLPATQYAVHRLMLKRSSTGAPAVWGPDPAGDPREAVCVGVVDPTQRDELAASFIVSDNDPDCDGLIEGDGRECNPKAWFGQRTANLDELTCLARSNQYCYLGGPRCVDDKPTNTNACAPTEYCVPSSVCTNCMNDLKCAEDTTRAPLRPAGYRCTVRVVNGDLCGDPIVLAEPPSNGIQCASALIGDPDHAFADHVDIDHGSYHTKLGSAPGCHVTIEPEGQPPGDVQAEIGMMVAVGLDNGHGIAVPVVLTFDHSATACTNAEVKCTPDITLAGQDLLACAASWSPPMPAPGLPEGAHDPTLTSDMLQIWFTTDDMKILHSSRPSIAASWSTPVPVIELGTDISHNVSPHVSGDGSSMMLSSDRVEMGAGTLTGYDLFVAKRPGPTQPWSTPTRILELASTHDETCGSRNGGETVMVFAADQDGPTSDLYQTFNTSGTLWSQPTRLGISTSVFSELDPFLSKDGQTLYYTEASLQATPLGAELYVTRRASITSAFAVPQRMVELSSPQDDKDPWVSDDARTIFFTSTRLGGVARIFFSTR